MKFQYIPGWIELNFQDISCAVYHTNVEIIYSHVFKICMCLLQMQKRKCVSSG